MFIKIHIINDKMDKAEVKVDVEYCGSCGHIKQFIDMMELIKKSVPTAEVVGTAGRQGSFEVKINDVLIHSKRQTLAFPEFSEVANVVAEVAEGQPVRKITNEHQQPIDCQLM